MTHFYRTNFSLVASILLLCLAPMVAGDDKTIWHGETTGDLNISWTEADLTATGANGNILFSARALAEKDFEADFLAAQSLDKDNPCDYQRSFTLLSVVGNIASLEDAQYVSCQSMPHPSIEVRFMAIDLAQSGKAVKLTDFFAESDIMKALLADAVIKSALKNSGAKTPATLMKLYEALEGIDITVKYNECEYSLAKNFLSRFAFHHVNKRNQVAIRLELPPIAHACNSTNINLGFYLPIPSALEKAFENARLGKAGFLMAWGKKFANQKSTEVFFSTETYKPVQVDYHTVVAFDTLYAIARKYGHPVNEIGAWNDLQPPYNLSIGQKLRLSAPVSVAPKWTQKDTIHRTLPEFVFKFIGEGLEPDAVVIKAIEIYRDNKSEPFQTLVVSEHEANTPVLEIEDINFDGYKDIRLVAFRPAGPNIPYFYWLFEPKTARFFYSEAFSVITSPEVDVEKQLIKSFWRDGAARHGTSHYKVIDYKPILVWQEEEIFQDDNRVKVIVRERVGGKMKIVSEKIRGDNEESAERLAEPWIVTASRVRVRSAPNTSANIVTKLDFGTIVEQLGKTAKPSRVGKTKAYWYHVSMADGKEGWIFGSLIASLAPSRNVKTFREIARQQLENQKLKTGELTDLFSFLSRVTGEVDKTIEIVAELKLMRLQTLRRVIEVVGWDWEKSQYKAWFKTQERLGNIYYIDFGNAGWFVDSNKYWALSKQYRSLPIGENIAWQAANLELGGECEGYLPCWVDVINQKSGQYLALYPNGKHVNEAFEDAVDWISPHMDIINNGSDYMGVGDDKEDQKMFMKNLRKLCQILTSVSHHKKAFFIKEIEKMFKQLGSLDKCR